MRSWDARKSASEGLGSGKLLVASQISVQTLNVDHTTGHLTQVLRAL